MKTRKVNDKAVQPQSGVMSEANHTPTPGKMYGILCDMTHDGKVGERTILAALESNDDPLKAFIVQAVNLHEELLDLVKRMKGVLQYHGHNDIEIAQADEAIAKAESK